MTIFLVGLTAKLFVSSDLAEIWRRSRFEFVVVSSDLNVAVLVTCGQEFKQFVSPVSACPRVDSSSRRAKTCATSCELLFIC